VSAISLRFNADSVPYRASLAIVAALLCLVGGLQALAPVPAEAVMANPGGGECELIAGGVYYNFTAQDFCTPNGGGGGLAGGGSTSTATEPEPGVIAISDTEGTVYCGSFSDVFVVRGQPCPRAGVACSSMNGCIGCSDDTGRCFKIQNPRQPPSKAAKKTLASEPKKLKEDRQRKLCKSYMDIITKAWHQHSDVYYLMRANGFSSDDILHGNIVWARYTSGSLKGYIMIMVPGSSVEPVLVPPINTPTGNPDDIWQSLAGYQSQGAPADLQWKSHHCEALGVHFVDPFPGTH